MNTIKPFVIALNVGASGLGYLADKPRWDGSWYTEDIGEARRYRYQANAERVIKSYVSAWEHLSPRVTQTMT